MSVIFLLSFINRICTLIVHKVELMLEEVSYMAIRWQIFDLRISYHLSINTLHWNSFHPHITKITTKNNMLFKGHFKAITLTTCVNYQIIFQEIVSSNKESIESKVNWIMKPAKDINSPIKRRNKGKKKSMNLKNRKLEL